MLNLQSEVSARIRKVGTVKAIKMLKKIVSNWFNFLVRALPEVKDPFLKLLFIQTYFKVSFLKHYDHFNRELKLEITNW